MTTSTMERPQRRDGTDDAPGACWRCRFFDREPGDAWDEGYCRRYPPRAIGFDEPVVLFPGVGAEDWCGEFAGE